MPAFRRRFYVDHCHLRDFRDYLSRGTAGVTSDRRGLERHVEHVFDHLAQARARGATDYLLFSRGFEYVLTYDELGLYGESHPRRNQAAVFRQALGAIFDRGVALGLNMWFHTNQFEFPEEVYQRCGAGLQGTERVCPGKELTWQLLEAKMREFFRLFPQCSGLQITASESQVPVLRCACPDCAHLSAAARVGKLISVTQRVAQSLGKECQVRPRSGLEGKPETYLEMIEGLDPSCVVATKHTRSDFYISEPFNPSLGLGHVGRAVEFDCWREWSGWNQFPCYMGDVFAERLRWTHQLGIDVVAARLNWSPEVNEIFARPWGNVVNLHVFDIVSRDIAASPDALLLTWLQDTYATREVKGLYKLYKLSHPAHHLAYSFLGRNCGDHSGVFRPRGSSQSFADRLESVMGKETCHRMLEQPSLLASRVLRLEATWDGLRTVLHNCRSSIPGDWFAEMQLGLENALSCAYVNTYMMLLYVHERAGRDRMPDALPLAEVEACLRRETAAWERRDQANYELMGGPAALDMLVEAEKAMTLA